VISSTHRFHGHTSLSYAYLRGKTQRSSKMSLKFVQNSHRTSYRAAVVVSRKVHKSAVKRNRIRRRIYAQIHANEGLINAPYDLVFTVYDDSIAEMPAAELSKLITEQLEKADVLKVTEPPHAIVKKVAKE
jgi:ribonuclease P protein component